MEFSTPALLAACLMIVSGCANPSALSRNSTEMQDQPDNNRLQLVGASPDEGRYSFAFTDGKATKASGTCEKMEYHWNGVKVVIAEGELRVDGKLLAELNDGDLIAFDASGDLMVNGDVVHRVVPQ